MPKIFEYLGIVIFFYSREHFPIHVHAAYGASENRVEFSIENGEIVEIKIKSVKGVKSLPANKLKDLEDFLKVYSQEIIQKWIEYFVYQKEVKFEKINTHLK